MKLDHQITVAELIEQLKQYDPKALVQTEGCDCIGPCDGTELDDRSGQIILLRNDRLG